MDCNRSLRDIGELNWSFRAVQKIFIGKLCCAAKTHSLIVLKSWDKSGISWNFLRGLNFYKGLGHLFQRTGHSLRSGNKSASNLTRGFQVI